MKNSTNSTESKTDSTNQTTTTTGYTEPKVETPAQEDSTDDFGYESEEKPKTMPVPPGVKKTEEEPPKTEEKPADKKLSVYGEEEPSKTEEPPKTEEKPAEELAEEEKAKKEITEVVKSLGDGFDVEKISKFALDNKFTKAQVEAYVKLTKAESQEIARKQEEAIKSQRKAWKEELAKDPEFGGENFDKNVDRVEKVLQNYMPNTKKVLTERGSMLPPYIMRDFLSLAKALNPTTKLVTGEPSEVKKEEGNFLDDMYS
jgi:hypothetical protein